MFRRQLSARDVMRPPGIMLREDDDAWLAARQLFESGQTGAPVLDAAGRLTGVISQTDLAGHLRDSARSASDFYSEPDHDPLPVRPPVPVSRLMSRVIVQVPEEMLLDEVERHMLRRRVQRVLVMRGETVAGVVSTTDLLRAR